MRGRGAADRRYRGGGLRRRLARAEGLQRRRGSRQRAIRPSFGASACPAIPTIRTAAISRPRPRASIVGSIYLPNGNPVGTEKFDYKMRWMERLCDHAAELLEEERPAVLCGDWNVVPEDRDVFSVRATQHDAVMQPEARQLMAHGSSTRAGPTPCARSIRRREALHLLGLYRRLLAARSRLPARPSALFARSCRPAPGRGRRQMGEGRGESERPRADLDRAQLRRLTERSSRRSGSGG